MKLVRRPSALGRTVRLRGEAFDSNARDFCVAARRALQDCCAEMEKNSLSVGPDRGRDFDAVARDSAAMPSAKKRSNAWSA